MDNKRCWICRRTFDEALRDFNNIILSGEDEELKSRITSDNEINENQYYVEGKLYPKTIMDAYPINVDSVKDRGDGTCAFKGLNTQMQIPLCDVCLSLVESIEQNPINYVSERFVSKEDAAQIRLILPEGDA